MLITHYYINKKNPFKQLSSISYEDYESLCLKLSLIPYKAFERFKNPQLYYCNRMLTEKWLYDSFKHLGGTPLIKSPYYFVLGESEYLQHCYGPNVLTKQLYISLEFSKYISFTIGDSISLYIKQNTRYVPKVYTYESIHYWLEYFDIDLKTLQSFLDSHKKIIEVQVWNPALLTLCQVE